MAKVLLADESVTIQKVVDLVLSEEGHEIKSVTSGEEALAAVDSFAPDIILADIKLKGKDGYEIAQAVKTNPATARIPVLLLAGAFEPAKEDLITQSGADGSLTKPFESKDLIEKIRSMTGGQAVPQAAPAEDAGEPVFAVEETTDEAVFSFDEASGEAETVAEAVETAPGAEEDMWNLGDLGEDSVEAEAVEAVETVEEEAVAIEAPGEPQATSPAMPAPQAPASTNLAGDFGDAVVASLAEMVKEIDVKAIVADIVAPTLRDTVEKILWEVTPELTERLLREAVKETLGSLNKDLENIIWETVPELAESIIKKEIEKIRSGS